MAQKPPDSGVPSQPAERCFWVSPVGRERNRTRTRDRHGVAGASWAVGLLGRGAVSRGLQLHRSRSVKAARRGGWASLFRGCCCQGDPEGNIGEDGQCHALLWEDGEREGGRVCVRAP